MSVRNPQHPDSARVAALKAALERDLDRMLQWRGPVTEVRRLVAELDHLDTKFHRASARAASPRATRWPIEQFHGEILHAR